MSPHRTGSLLTLLLCLTGPALALQEGGRAKRPEREAKGHALEEKGPPDLRKATSILGARPKNPAGDQLPAIDDLLVDPRNGRVEFVVLGDRPAPFSRLRRQGKKDEEGALKRPFVLAASPEKIAAAPPLLPSMQRDFTAWAEQVHAHYGTQPRPYTSYDKELSRKHAATTGALRDVQHLYRMSQLAGREVLDADGQRVGKLVDVAVDLQHQRFAYVALGLEGGGGKVALPWSVLQPAWSEGELRLTLPVPAARVAGAPAYDPDDWEAMSSPEFVREVYAYARVESYAPGVREAGHREGEHDEGD